MSPTVAGVVTAVVVAGLSLVVAILAGVSSRMAWRPGGVVVPWGLLLGVGASVATVVLARGMARPLGFAAAGGWVAGLAALLNGRPEGDYVIAGDLLGNAFLLSATGGVLVTAMWRAVPAGDAS